jgi:hypothetical protein
VRAVWCGVVRCGAVWWRTKHEFFSSRDLGSLHFTHRKQQHTHTPQ